MNTFPSYVRDVREFSWLQSCVVSTAAAILILLRHNRTFIITKPRVQIINRLAIIRKEGRGRTHTIANQYIDLAGDINKIPDSIMAVFDPQPSTLYEA